METVTLSVCTIWKSFSLERFFQHEYGTSREGSYSPGPCVFVWSAPAMKSFGERVRGARVMPSSSYGRCSLRGAGTGRRAPPAA